MNDIQAGFHRDFGMLLRERAEDARRDAAVAKHNGSETGFELGCWHGYWAVMALLVSQARAFQLPLPEIGFSEDFDPDQELGL